MAQRATDNCPSLPDMLEGEFGGRRVAPGVASNRRGRALLSPEHDYPSGAIIRRYGPHESVERPRASSPAVFPLEAPGSRRRLLVTAQDYWMRCQLTADLHRLAFEDLRGPAIRVGGLARQYAVRLHALRQLFAMALCILALAVGARALLTASLAGAMGQTSRYLRRGAGDRL